MYFSQISDHVLQSHSKTGKIIILLILIFRFLDKSWEDKMFGLNNSTNLSRRIKDKQTIPYRLVLKTFNIDGNSDIGTEACII